GADMRPAFEGKPIKRTKPLYWRTHISSKDSRVAVRVDDWKIVADDSLTNFLLFDMSEDATEPTDLSQAQPEGFERMKRTLLDMDQDVLNDGPAWWKGDSTGGVSHIR